MVKGSSYQIFMFKRPVRIVANLITLVAFLFSLIGNDLLMARAYAGIQTGSVIPPHKELDADTFTLPQYLGHVRDTSIGKSPKNIVIHIQDAHCNYGAQLAISNIIAYLHDEYGISALNLEGGTGDYDLAIFAKIEDKKVREKVADYFVKEGLVSGAEYYSINNPDKARLWGVEDAALYKQNLNVYRESLKSKPVIDEYLKTLDHIITNLKRRIYNEELMVCDDKYSEYKTGKIEFKDYLTFLKDKSNSHGIEIDKYENIGILLKAISLEDGIDFKIANIERDCLIEAFKGILSTNMVEEFAKTTLEYKAGRISDRDYYIYLVRKAQMSGYDLKDYPELRKFIDYISAYENVDRFTVMEELSDLETAVKETIFENSEQRTLDTLSKNLVLMKNIFGISISREDYEYYKANESSFRISNYESFISQNGPLYKITASLPEGISRIDQYRTALIKFYEYSFERDRAFMKNMRYGNVETEHTLPQQIAIIVTGGFHTGSLCEMLKQQGTSYVSIMPNFKSEEGCENSYFRLLNGTMTKSGNTVYSRLASVLPSTMAVAALSTALGKEVWGERNIDAYKAWVGLKTIAERDVWDINKILNIQRKDESQLEIVFRDSSPTVLISMNELFYQAGEVIDQEMKKGEFYEIDANDISRITALSKAKSLGQGVQQSIDDLVNGVGKEAHKIYIQEVTSLPDGQAEHAGGWGVSIRKGLGQEQKTIAILHGILAGFLENHEIVEEITTLLMNDDLIKAQELFSNAKKHSINGKLTALWQMSDAERLGIADRRDFAEMKGFIPESAAYSIDQVEDYDDVVIKELAKQRGVSVDDIEADFERTVLMLEDKINYQGFVDPQEDAIANKIHKIYSRLIEVYQTKTDTQPGKFHIVDQSEINAFVIRNRTDVYFYRGLYEALYDISLRTGIVLTEDIIAFIIAHELAHALQHTSHQGLDVKDLNESVSPYLVQMIKNGEHDADMRALDLMDEAKFSVFGAIDAIGMLEFITLSGQVENVLSSHPYISLRKHRLSGIILEQKIIGFQNARAKRVVMTGKGRMKSRDADFRMIMDRKEEELLKMAQSAGSVSELDEILGMRILRKRMDAMKTLINSDKIKTDFMRNTYIQAVLEAYLQGSGRDLPYKAIDFSDMRAAAAIYDFGTILDGKNVLEIPEENFSGEVTKTEDRLKKFPGYEWFNEDQKMMLKSLRSNIPDMLKIAKSLSHKDFDKILMPYDKVKYLIPIFKIDEKQKLDPKTVISAINKPNELISAYFYANYLGQVASKELDLLAVKTKIMMRGRENSVYLENPAYRKTGTDSEREALKNIALLHYAMGKTKTNILEVSVYTWGLDELNIAPENVGGDFCIKYFKLLAEKLPGPIAANIALRKVKDYFGVDLVSLPPGSVAEHTASAFNENVNEMKERSESEYQGDPSGLRGYIKEKVREYVENEPFIVFIRNSIDRYRSVLPKEAVDKFTHAIEALLSDHFFNHLDINEVLDSLADIYANELIREETASSLFTTETRLDYFSPTTKRVSSLKQLMSMPDWAVSDYIDKNKYDVGRLIKDALEHGMNLDDICDFMKKRLNYQGRFDVFENTFFGYGSKPIYLYDYFKTACNNDVQEILLWFRGMFAKTDALKLMTKLCSEHLIKKAQEKNDLDKARRYRRMAAGLAEYVFSQASNTFHPDPKLAAIYLDILTDDIKDSEKAGDDDFINQTVYNAMMVLSPAVKLEIELSCSFGIDKNADADFKSRKTSIAPAKKDPYYDIYKSRFSLHNFAWNQKSPSHQSIFILRLARLSMDQIKELLAKRFHYIKAQSNIEYRKEVLISSGFDDPFSELLMILLLKKIKNPSWTDGKEDSDILDELIEIEVGYYTGSKDVALSTTKKILIPKDIADLSFDEIKRNLSGVALPGLHLDKMWKWYVEKNRLYERFPDFSQYLQSPNACNKLVTDPMSFLTDYSYGEKVSYRQLAKKFFSKSSVYADFFNRYCKISGKGYVWGGFRPLKERLEWMEEVLTYKSVIRDSVIDLWEADLFPEVISGLPGLAKKVQDASNDTTGVTDVWSLLGEMDDDIGRLKELQETLNITPDRLHELLGFYTRILRGNDGTPYLISAQKIARYGATAYILWSKLPENADFGFEEHFEAMKRYMPEPSVLRDDLLFILSNKYVRYLDQAPLVSGELYSNNLLSRNRDLRTEDFMSETLLHMFGGAKTEDRRDILLWMMGAQGKPKFVLDVEEKYNIDFTTLPADMRFVPKIIREKLIEGFMLGDNGVLDPQNDSDRSIMNDFLEKLFLYIFPKGTQGIGDEDRLLLSKVFIIVMKAYLPYRRVQIIKDLAELRTRADYETSSTGERLAVLLGSLGPVGIKVAQYLSENKAMVPDDKMRSSLGKLRHSAPEITKLSLCSALRNEIPSGDVLVREIQDPVGIASIKQVNRGTWLDVHAVIRLLKSVASESDRKEIKSKVDAYQGKMIGTNQLVAYLLEKAGQYKIDLNDTRLTVPVVYKVRRPNMEATLGIDYLALDAVARELKGVEHNGEKLNIVDLVQTVKEWINLEMNFKKEVEFHNKITELDISWSREIQKKAGVKVVHPRIYACTDSVIVEEDIKGISLSKLLLPDEITPALQKAGYAEEELSSMTNKVREYDYDDVCELLRQILLHQIFEDGVFHADLHQGNVLITPDGRISMIDRGNVGFLNGLQREGAKTLFKGLMLRDASLIKNGIDTIFINADYPKGDGPKASAITVKDIDELLNKKQSLELTIGYIGSEAVKGAKDYAGARNFSTLLKSFTQAMYLFPTDPTDMKNTGKALYALAKYIDLNAEEIMRAIEWKKYFKSGDSSEDEAKKGSEEHDIIKIARRLFHEKTDGYFLSSIWQPIVLYIMMYPAKTININDRSALYKMLEVIKACGPKILEKNIDLLVKNQNSMVDEVLKSLITVDNAKVFLNEYIELRMKGSKWGKLASPIMKPFIGTILLYSRPFIGIFTNAVIEWMETTGKLLISSSIPMVVLDEGIGYLPVMLGNGFQEVVDKYKRVKAQQRAKPLSSGSGRMKELSRRQLDEDSELDLFKRHREFERLSKDEKFAVIDGSTRAEPDTMIEAKIVYADLGRELESNAQKHRGAYHFMSSQKDLIIVLNSRNKGNSELENEALYHEVREFIWLKRSLDGIPVTQHQAHVIAAQEEVSKFSNDFADLTPYHSYQLNLMTREEKDDIASETESHRVFQHATLELANKLGAGLDINGIKKYEKTFRSALSDDIKKQKAVPADMTTTVPEPAIVPTQDKSIESTITPIAIRNDLTARRAAIVRGFPEAMKSKEVITIVGLPKEMFDIENAPAKDAALIKTSKILGKAGYGERGNGHQIVAVPIDSGDAAATEKAFQEEIEKASTEGSMVVVFAPQREDMMFEIGEKKTGIAQALRELYKDKDAKNLVKIVPDAYADSKPSEKEYPDVLIRVLLARHIAWYYGGNEDILKSIREIMSLVSDTPINAIDDLFNVLAPIKITAISYESIKDYFDSYTEIAVSL